MKIKLILLCTIYLLTFCAKDNDHDHEAESAELIHSETAHVDEDGHKHEGEEAHDHDHEHEGAIKPDKKWEELIGLETGIAQLRPIEILLRVPGKIIANPDKKAVVSPFIKSSVNSVFANRGDYVKKGDLLACLSSPEIGIMRADYSKAKAETEIAAINMERKDKLKAEDIISEKSFLEAKLQKKVADVNYNYALEKLLALGLKKEEIDEPLTDHGTDLGSTIHVYAPVSGVVTMRNADIGKKAGPDNVLFEIIDPSELWIEADIYEKDLPKISKGLEVQIAVSAYPDKTFTGTIFFIASDLNPQTRTIKIMAKINNEEKLLKAGMFAHTAVVTGYKENALVVPTSTVLDDEHVSIVFIRDEHGYERRAVKTGLKANGFTEILSGLEAGMTIVTKGNFELKSKASMTGVDPHAGHNH